MKYHSCSEKGRHSSVKYMKTKILYEDTNIFVCRKPAGVAVQAASDFQQDMVSELKNEISRRTGERNPYLGIVHRLDQPVEGLLVFAGSKQAAARLSAQLADGTMQKRYVAVLAGVPEEKQGIRVDYLKKDSRSGRSLIVSGEDKLGKRAELSYRIMEEQPPYALAEIEIRTGRYHQIRAQMAHMGYPLVGDYKYGGQEIGKGDDMIKVRNAGLALCACYLAFQNPETGKRQQFTVRPENPVFEIFRETLIKTLP